MFITLLRPAIPIGMLTVVDGTIIIGGYVIPVGESREVPDRIARNFSTELAYLESRGYISRRVLQQETPLDEGISVNTEIPSFSPEQQETTVSDKQETDLYSLTVKELKQRCQERNIPIPPGATKAKLIELLS